MRKTSIALFALTTGCCYGQFASGRQSTRLELPTTSQHAQVMQRLGLTNITVTYSRPQVGGRKIWGDVVKYGEPWRAGANDNTTIQLSTAATIEGKPLAAGSYAVHMIPAPDAWTVAFSNNHTSWGSFSYKAEEDALRVRVNPRAAEMQEALAYEFNELHPDSAELTLRWEKLAVPIRIAVDADGLTLTSIRNQLRHLPGYDAESWDDGAEWLLDRKSNLNAALELVDRSIQMQPVFHNLQTKSRIQAVMGRKDDAAATMKLALQDANATEVYTYGRSLQREGMVAEAMDVFRQVAAKEPASWVAHIAIARVRSWEKRFPDAAVEAKAALPGAPLSLKKAIEGYIGKLEKGVDIN